MYGTEYALAVGDKNDDEDDEEDLFEIWADVDGVDDEAEEFMNAIEDAFAVGDKNDDDDEDVDLDESRMAGLNSLNIAWTVINSKLGRSQL